MHGIFQELGLVLIAATAFTVLVRQFRLPPLVGYIATGIVLGPVGTQFLHNQELFEAMREIGTALLLFFVGLEIDWQKGRRLMGTVWKLGLVQILGALGLSAALGLFFDFTPLGIIYVGLALASSSTVVIVKLLSEARDLNSLHGRLSTGVLLFQDMVMVVALVILAGISTPSFLDWPSLLLILVAKGLSLIIVLGFLSKYALPKIFGYFAHSHELLFVASLAWCFLLAITLNLIQLPIEIGAFLAGLSLGILPYSTDIANRLRSVRDFFVILLFVAIGSSFLWPSARYAAIMAVLLASTLVAKPLITLIALELAGYKSRTAFFTALTQNQLSEFSLILMSMAAASNVVSPELANAITFVAILSIFFSTIFLGYRRSLFQQAKPILHAFERKEKSFFPALQDPPQHQDHIIIFGYHRMGYHIFKKLQHTGREIVIVDTNPDIIQALQEHHQHCLYGDVQDEEVYSLVSTQTASIIVSTIPYKDETEFLIGHVKKINRKAIVVVTAHNVEDALSYYEQGVDYVILPHLLGGEHVGEVLMNDKLSSIQTSLHRLAMPVIRLHANPQEPYFD